MKLFYIDNDAFVIENISSIKSYLFSEYLISLEISLILLYSSFKHSYLLSSIKFSKQFSLYISPISIQLFYILYYITLCFCIMNR